MDLTQPTPLFTQSLRMTNPTTLSPRFPMRRAISFFTTWRISFSIRPISKQWSKPGSRITLWPLETTLTSSNTSRHTSMQLTPTKLRLRKLLVRWTLRHGLGKAVLIQLECWTLPLQIWPWLKIWPKSILLTQARAQRAIQFMKAGTVACTSFS